MEYSLVSPRSSKPLLQINSGLSTADGTEHYTINDGIVDLIAPELLDEQAEQEIESFAQNPVVGVSYFRHSLYDHACKRLKSYLSQPENKQLRFAEYGGGEGYLAREFARQFDSKEVYVLDICDRYLRLAPENLKRIRCDIRLPSLEPGSLHAGAFWVSLHHFSAADMQHCLNEAYKALAPGGALILFEPNARFFPRQILMGIKALRNKVYFDEAETYLDCKSVLELCYQAGFQLMENRFINPPYSIHFLKRLKMGYLFFCPTEILHLCDICGLSGLAGNILGGYWGLYFFSILQKPV